MYSLIVTLPSKKHRCDFERISGFRHFRWFKQIFWTMIFDAMGGILNLERSFPMVCDDFDQYSFGETTFHPFTSRDWIFGNSHFFSSNADFWTMILNVRGGILNLEWSFGMVCDDIDQHPSGGTTFHPFCESRLDFRKFSFLELQRRFLNHLPRPKIGDLRRRRDPNGPKPLLRSPVDLYVASRLNR